MLLSYVMVYCRWFLKVLFAPQHRPQDLPPLSPCCLCPLHLRVTCFFDRSVDAVGGCGVDLPKELAGSRGIALDGAGAGDLEGEESA